MTKITGNINKLRCTNKHSNITFTNPLQNQQIYIIFSMSYPQ